MPDVFKALASILAWIMWISSLVVGFSTMIMGIVRGELYSLALGQMPITYPVMFAVTGFYAIIAVVIMILRKNME